MKILVFCVSNRQIWRHLALFSLCDFLHSALEKAAQSHHFCEKIRFYVKISLVESKTQKNVFYNLIKLSKQFCTLKSIKKVTFLHFLLKHSHAARKLCFSMPRIPDYAFIMLQNKVAFVFRKVWLIEQCIIRQSYFLPCVYTSFVDRNVTKQPNESLAG